MFFSILSSLVLTSAQAEKIEFPDEELAQESVLPKFDHTESVRRRNVVTEKRFEVGGYYGWNIIEPIYNQSKFGLNFGYHFSEMSAFMVNYAQWSSGLNTIYTDGLQDVAVSDPTLDFTRVPKLKYSLYGHYEWKAFYGKISVTKQGVLNLSTYPIIGVGWTAYEHKNYPGFDFGIGQKFYFGKNFALRADFKMQFGQTPSPFLREKLKSNSPRPTPDQFQDKFTMGTILDIGVSILL